MSFHVPAVVTLQFLHVLGVGGCLIIHFGIALSVVLCEASTNGI